VLSSIIMLSLAMLAAVLGLVLVGCYYCCCRAGGEEDSPLAKFARAASDLADEYNDQVSQ